MTIQERTLYQVAPWPQALDDIVAACDYRPGWKVWLARDAARDDVDGVTVGRGATLVIRSQGYDTYHVDRGETYGVLHYFIVPAATYDYRAWTRWLLDRLIDVETHEACEFFQVDLARPFAPNHGPGRNPYSIIELGSNVDSRTRPSGAVVEA